MAKPRQTDDWPETIDSGEQLEELLSRPTEEVVTLLGQMKGDLAVIGAGGKIGPSLTAMACRARDLAGTDQQIFAVSRFSDPQLRERIASAGAKTIAVDLLDPAAVESLPPAENVIYMAGMKFGTSGNPASTWATNALVPVYVTPRYRNARIVAFSTGCVYDFVPVKSAGSVESDPLTPIGEYSNSCVARERIFEHLAGRLGTRVLQLRLNYAVEMRYGVLVDLALEVLAGRPIDVTMGYFNVIWQGDVNAAALRLLEHAANPARPLNLTGADKLSIRQVAARLGELMGREVSFAGAEAPTAALSDARQAHRLLGPPAVSVDRLLRWTAQWVSDGNETLGKPTHFQTRDGQY